MRTVVHFYLRTDNSAATTAGELGVHYSKMVMGEGGGADFLGEALLTLGVAFGMQRNHEMASERLAEYLRYLDQYTTARALHQRVLANLGISFRWLRLPRKAAESFWAALEAMQDNLSSDAEKVRRSLVWELMNIGEIAKVPALLEASSQYLQANPDDREAALAYELDLGRYYLMTDQQSLGGRKCTAVLQQATAFPHIQAAAALTLMHVARERQLSRAALTMAVVAKVYAGQSGREDLDEEATYWLKELDALEDHSLMPQLMVDMGQIRAQVATKWQTPAK